MSTKQAWAELGQAVMTYDVMTNGVMIYDMGRLGQSDFSFHSAVLNSNFWGLLSSVTLRFPN